jgi:hypothetical protein
MEQRATAPQRKLYRTPRLIVHGSIEAITETSNPSPMVEKHPMELKKGSKIRPR